MGFCLAPVVTSLPLVAFPRAPQLRGIVITHKVMEGHENPQDSQSVVLEPPITMPLPGHICREGNLGNTIYQSPLPPSPTVRPSV